MKTIRISLGGTFIVAASLLTNGCVSAFPDYPVHPAMSYQRHVEQDGVIVAIHPVEQASEQKKYFDVNLSRRGILPIFVVIGNHNSQSSVLVSKEDIGLYARTQGVSEDMLPSGAAAKGFQVAGCVLISVPILAIASAIEANAENIKYNFRVKELTDQMLSHKESTSGFVYFRLPDKNAPLEDIIAVRLRMLPSKEYKEFLFDLQKGEYVR